MSLCLASAGIVKTLAVAAFTLVWTHSIEKIDWQEDWRVTSGGLELVQARVKGSGAGMEPPPDARLVDGWFQWQPKRAPMPEVVLGNSGAAGEWRICSNGHCRTLSEFFGFQIGSNVTTMSACNPYGAKRNPGSRVTKTPDFARAPSGLQAYKNHTGRPPCHGSRARQRWWSAPARSGRAGATARPPR